MTKLNFALLLGLILAFSIPGLGHGGKKHQKDSVKQDSSVVTKDTSHAEHHHEAGHKQATKVKADLDEFPSLHPLIVHFAIVLLIIAAILQLINLILLKKEFAWIIAGLIVSGFTVAMLASTKFHPHTHGMSDHARQILALHDQYAEWTLYLAGIAATLQVLNLFFFKTRRQAFAIVAFVMIASAYCVAHAGHYGAQLVHIEGVGPQGKYLETGHHH
jgi:uncharacterized membrane protein